MYLPLVNNYGSISKNVKNESVRNYLSYDRRMGALILKVDLTMAQNLYFK